MELEYISIGVSFRFHCKLNFFVVSRGEVQSTSTLNDWARYVNRMNRQDLT